MEAIALLLDDHKQLRALLSRLEKATTRTQGPTLEKVAALLKAHTKIEEQIFYPAFKEAGKKKDDDKMYFEALEEHRAAGELVLPDLLQTSIGTDQFGGRAKVLKELVEHHAGEEEKEMFPRARKLLDIATRKELGEQMGELRKTLLAKSR
jgi:hemerythrin-like domain-containing protein